MNDVDEHILQLISHKSLSVDDIYTELNKLYGYSERIVKESILRLRTQYKIKPNREWKMELYVED
jgi:hypothetical protein